MDVAWGETDHARGRVSLRDGPMAHRLRSRVGDGLQRTLCRRYGVIWAFGHDGVDVHVTGPTRAYTPASAMDFCFCETCGNMIYSRGRGPSENGKVRAAVNLRLADPDAVADIPLEHQDCLVTYEEILPRGRVKEVWF